MRAGQVECERIVICELPDSPRRQADGCVSVVRQSGRGLDVDRLVLGPPAQLERPLIEVTLLEGEQALCLGDGRWDERLVAKRLVPIDEARSKLPSSELLASMAQGGVR